MMEKECSEAGRTDPEGSCGEKQDVVSEIGGIYLRNLKNPSFSKVKMVKCVSTHVRQGVPLFSKGLAEAQGGTATCPM